MVKGVSRRVKEKYLIVPASKGQEKTKQDFELLRNSHEARGRQWTYLQVLWGMSWEGQGEFGFKNFP
jgi:hypothetical protein